jgi:uncharacterized protein
MKTSFARFIACFVILSSVFVIAQEGPASKMHTNTVLASANGTFEANPDTAILGFNVFAQAATSGAAYTQAAGETDKVRQALRASGIEPSAASFSAYSIQPMYDYRDPKQKLVGYRVEVNVSLKLKDFSKIGPLLQKLADANITENQSVSYTLENMEQAKVKAVQDAFRKARNAADALAEAAGRALGQLSYASVDVNESERVISPMRVMAGLGAERVAAPNEQFTPQKVQVTAHVTAQFELK